MLNTLPTKKINNVEKPIMEDNIIDDGIRQINEQMGGNDDNPQNFHSLAASFEKDKAMKTFQSMENKIFGNIQNDISFVPTSKKTNEFNFNEITQKYSDEEIRKYISNDDKQLLISLNEKLNKISIFDTNNNALGYFTIQHIAKYLADVYDTKQQFLNNIDSKIYDKAKQLIKTLFFKLNYNKTTNYVSFDLFDYTQSGLMADVELLVKISNMLDNYVENLLQNDISNIDNNNKLKVEQNIKKFSFLLMNYILKLIGIISEKIKDDPTKEALKNSLIKYSVSLVYKINIFVQSQLKIIHTENQSIKNTLSLNIKVKEELVNKLKFLTK